MKPTPTLTMNWPHWRNAPNIFKVTIAVAWHVLALLALFLFGWLELLLFVISTYITLQFGLVLGYHRLLSHRCFETSRWFKRCLSLVGTLAMQDGPISWAAIHRFHHRSAEQDFDPHSPRHGLSWAHFIWTFYDHPRLSISSERLMLARDLQADPFIRFCEENFLLINLAAALTAFFAGVWIGGLWKGFAFFSWLICARAVFLWHVTFLTNSIGHRLGYRNFDTPDDSRNVYVLGIMALGDGWHNNHHAFPNYASHGLRWFEIDITYRLIRFLERVGIAWNVRHPMPKMKLVQTVQVKPLASKSLTSADAVLKG